MAALALVGASACDAAAPTDADVVAALDPVGEAGVTGKSRAALEGDHLTVEIHADDLEPNRIHEQFIHMAEGRTEDRSCPGSDADLNGDGVVDFDEVEEAYGPGALALEPFPTVGSEGELDYELTFTVDPDEIQPLEATVLVLYGTDGEAIENGGEEYLPHAAVACGTMEAAS